MHVMTAQRGDLVQVIATGGIGIVEETRDLGDIHWSLVVTVTGRPAVEDTATLEDVSPEQGEWYASNSLRPVAGTTLDP
jgi:hypothetical protein